MGDDRKGACHTDRATGDCCTLNDPLSTHLSACKTKKQKTYENLTNFLRDLSDLLLISVKWQE